MIRVAGLACAIAATVGMSPARAQPAPELRSAFSITSGCEDQRETGEIVVCARRRDDERYRLPLRDQESAALGAGPARGEVPRASAEASPSAPCGIFEGQRRCNRREMAEFGYFGGRDPVTFVTRIIEAVAEPE